MISDEDIDKALAWLVTNADKGAQARAEREYVEEYRRVVKAEIMREHAAIPLGAQEAVALSDPRYKQHLEALKEAIHKDEYIRWMKSAAEAKIEAWRTMCSNNRAQGKI